MTFGFSDGRETFVSSFLFLEKFWFCTDKIDFIELPNLVTRVHLDDCFDIHILYLELCDLLLSSHQNFLLEVRLRQCGFCKVPLFSWSICRCRSSEMRINIVFARYHFSSQP